MRELTTIECQEVSGGPIPVIVGVIAFRAALAAGRCAASPACRTGVVLLVTTIAGRLD